MRWTRKYDSCRLRVCWCWSPEQQLLRSQAQLNDRVKNSIRSQAANTLTAETAQQGDWDLTLYAVLARTSQRNAGLYMLGAGLPEQAKAMLPKEARCTAAVSRKVEVQVTETAGLYRPGAPHAPANLAMYLSSIHNRHEAHNMHLQTAQCASRRVKRLMKHMSCKRRMKCR